MEASSFGGSEQLLDTEICIEEIENVLKLLKLGKSGGPDGLSPEHIVYGGEVLKIWLKKTIRPYCVGVDVSDIFFNSTAERFAIYSEFRYISLIFPTVFSQLISIFIRILHTFSMGAKTRA